ncbi:MAG: tetratricopeptide repeat protein [Phycisphaeraceae bacterium]|nr:tetratricopeptide repeat protein [Phycisphaeraceae bacterium]
MTTWLRLTDVVLLGVLAFAAGCGDQTMLVRQSSTNGNKPRNTELARQLNHEAAGQMRDKQWAKAQSLLEQSLKADPAFGPAMCNLGIVQQQQGKVIEASQCYQRAAERLPDQATPRNNLALLYEKAGKYDDAVSLYDKAHSLDPANAEIRANLARARCRRGDRDESLKQLLTEIATQDPRPQWTQWAHDQQRRLFP